MADIRLEALCPPLHLIPHGTPNRLRHAHATTLIEAGTHIKTVQTRLGHSSPSLTMSVYAHVSPGMDRDAANAYAKALEGP